MLIVQGVTLLPLHGGKAPRWLFARMVKLGGLISEAVIDEYGSKEFIRRLGDPYWFQALSCAIGYDWHSSGTTTVTLGALKEALNGNSDIFIAGGKGNTGTSTPEQIADGTDKLSIPNESERFIGLSRTIAKIDSGLVYNDVSIYHHVFLFSKDSDWGIIQQGMIGGKSHYAVRFQVLGESVNEKDVTNETNRAVVSNLSEVTTDMTYSMNSDLKKLTVDLVNDDIRSVLNGGQQRLFMPSRHKIYPEVDLSTAAKEALLAASEMRPGSYQELLNQKGIGARTLRSLAIISSLVYDTLIYKRDPVMYAYNLGGKDGIPYKINLKQYDDVVNAMAGIVNNAKIDKAESTKIMKRLSRELARKYTDLTGPVEAKL